MFDKFAITEWGRRFHCFAKKEEKIQLKLLKFQKKIHLHIVSSTCIYRWGNPSNSLNTEKKA